MKNNNLEKMPRKKLSEYTRYGDGLRSMYIIIFSIIWIGWVIWKSYSNWDYMTDKSSEILSLLPFLLFWCVFLWFWIYTLNKRIKEKK
jgi:4-hydroxybenzoate polyprenyltransferase